MFNKIMKSLPHNNRLPECIRKLKMILFIDLNKLSSDDLLVNINDMIEISDKETIEEFVDLNLHKFTKIDFLLGIIKKYKIIVKNDVIIKTIYNNNLSVVTRMKFLNSCLSFILIPNNLFEEMFSHCSANNKLEHTIFEEICKSNICSTITTLFDDVLINIYLIHEDYHTQQFINYVSKNSHAVNITDSDTYVKLLNKNIIKITFENIITFSHLEKLIEHGHTAEFIESYQQATKLEYDISPEKFLMSNAIRFLNWDIFKFLHNENLKFFSFSDIKKWTKKLNDVDKYVSFLEKILEHDPDFFYGSYIMKDILFMYSHSSNLRTESKLFKLMKIDYDLYLRQTLQKINELYEMDYDKLNHCVNNLEKIYPNHHFKNYTKAVMIF